MKIFKENKVFAFLITIVVICFIIMMFLLIRYFLVGGSTSYYGDRLDDLTKENRINDEDIKKIETSFKENEKIEKVTVNTKGKILYVTLLFKSDVQLDDAKGISIKCLDNLNDNQKKVYDVQMLIKSEKTDTSDGFVIMGSKNASAESISWNNNTPVEEKTSEGVSE